MFFNIIDTMKDEACLLKSYLAFPYKCDYTAFEKNMRPVTYSRSNFIKNVCLSLVINENIKKFPPFLAGLSFMNLLFKVAAKVFKKSASGSG